MWDHSRPPSPWSKHRRVTAAERDAQARVADTMRHETACMLAGKPIPPKRRRRQKREDGGRMKPISPAEAEQLGEFIATHGHEILSVLNMARGEVHEFEIARAYRAILRGEPRAHEGWLRVVRRFSSM
jgi:hypothetical protein